MPDIVLDSPATTTIITIPAAPGFSFSAALVAIKEGQRVRRAGWSGEGTWLALAGQDGNWSGSIGGGAMPAGWRGFLPFIGVYTERALFLPWQASHADLLADDWMLVLV